MQNKFKSSASLDGEECEVFRLEHMLEFASVLALNEGLVLVTPAFAA